MMSLYSVAEPPKPVLKEQPPALNLKYSDQVVLTCLDKTNGSPVEAEWYQVGPNFLAFFYLTKSKTF